MKILPMLYTVLLKIPNYQAQIMIRTVQTVRSIASTYMHATNTKEQNKQSYYAKVKLGKSTIKFQIDSGSTANIIDEFTFANIQKENPSIQLTK
jgi:hypothetical protein